MRRLWNMCFRYNGCQNLKFFKIWWNSNKMQRGTFCYGKTNKHSHGIHEPCQLMKEKLLQKHLNRCLRRKCSNHNCSIDFERPQFDVKSMKNNEFDRWWIKFMDFLESDAKLDIRSPNRFSTEMRADVKVDKRSLNHSNFKPARRKQVTICKDKIICTIGPEQKECNTQTYSEPLKDYIDILLNSELPASDEYSGQDKFENGIMRYLKKIDIKLDNITSTLKLICDSKLYNPKSEYLPRVDETRRWATDFPKLFNDDFSKDSVNIGLSSRLSYHNFESFRPFPFSNSQCQNLYIPLSHILSQEKLNDPDPENIYSTASESGKINGSNDRKYIPPYNSDFLDPFHLPSASCPPTNFLNKDKSNHRESEIAFSTASESSKIHISLNTTFTQ